jgi:hypothetical protein
MWLEREWTCPECVAPMHIAPFRHYSEEAWIAAEYPLWNDQSEVDYNWDDLIFPKRTQRLIIQDDWE